MEKGSLPSPTRNSFLSKWTFVRVSQTACLEYDCDFAFFHIIKVLEEGSVLGLLDEYLGLRSQFLEKEVLSNKVFVSQQPRNNRINVSDRNLFRKEKIEKVNSKFLLGNAEITEQLKYTVHEQSKTSFFV